MRGTLTSYAYILGTVLLMTYAQLAVKLQLNKMGELPEGGWQKIVHLVGQVRSIWVLTAVAAIGLGALLWMAALTRFELSYAYPFMSLSFVLVSLLSIPVLDEPFSWVRLGGIALIAMGIAIVAIN